MFIKYIALGRYNTHYCHIVIAFIVFVSAIIILVIVVLHGGTSVQIGSILMPFEVCIRGF
jgi:hypothetical protein